MSVGVLLGYFEPLHLGHLADINLAMSKVDTLHIVVLPRKEQGKFALTLQDKARAVQVACEFFDFVKVHTADSLGLEQFSWAYDEGSKRLSDDIYQAVSIKLARNLAKRLVTELDLCEPKIFIKQDVWHTLERWQGYKEIQGFDFEILPKGEYDSKEIFKNPIANFGAIAPSARQDYSQTVCIVGGESSGKTTLVHKLANHFGVNYVLEMGRLYTHSDLGGTEVGLQYSDYPIIASRHLEAIQNTLKYAAAPITIVDTDFVTTQAFCQTYEGRSHPVLTACIDSFRMDYTIMLENNVPWVADGMRSLGSDNARQSFTNTLRGLMNEHGIEPFVVSAKGYHERYRQAVQFIENVVLKDDD